MLQGIAAQANSSTQGIFRLTRPRTKGTETQGFDGVRDVLAALAAPFGVLVSGSFRSVCILVLVFPNLTSLDMKGNLDS
jgi:hypothetical protein